MSEPYQIFTFIPDGVEPHRAIAETNRILREHGGELDVDSTLYLADLNEQELDPEPITDGSEALERLASHASLGSIDYAMPEGMTNVEFKGLPGRVQFVAISIPPKAFDAGGAESRHRYQAVARELHAAFGATRTIFDWGLWSRGIRWDEELARLAAHRFDGSFDLLDLH